MRDVFDTAADAVVAGDEALLERLLAGDPALARARAARPHGATLLHYVAANGVEEERQRSPPNAVAVARRLLDAGAEVDATCDAYERRYSTMNLLVSSVHPARAGVQVPLVHLLVDRGADVELAAGHDTPLHTALAFGYLAAAEALAERGARVDLVSAAGLGHESAVDALLDSDRDALDTALLRAAWFDRRAIAARLVAAGASLAARDSQGMTPAHLAAWRGHVALLEQLIAAGAPLAEQNRYGASVLGMARWAQANGHFPGADHPAIIAILLAAGAT